MWLKFYRDYPVDTPLIKNRLQSVQGIIGCEMHELNGWGNTLPIPLEIRDYWIVQKGNHTSDIAIHYHQWPKCKQMIESRKKYAYTSSQYSKELNCLYCGHHFTGTQAKKKRPISIFSSEESVEWDWSNN
ncbi:MAG: hypothetical protein ACXWM7_03485 [Parachlamydiaceae bacterium]